MSTVQPGDPVMLKRRTVGEWMIADGVRLDDYDDVWVDCLWKDGAGVWQRQEYSLSDLRVSARLSDFMGG